MEKCKTCKGPARNWIGNCAYCATDEVSRLEAELEQRIGQIARMEIRKHELEAELKAKDEQIAHYCVHFCTKAGIGFCEGCPLKEKEPGQEGKK